MVKDAIIVTSRWGVMARAKDGPMPLLQAWIDAWFEKAGSLAVASSGWLRIVTTEGEKVSVP